jgi:RNA polymerase I-specific transcription initiation factor RRN7
VRRTALQRRFVLKASVAERNILEDYFPIATGNSIAETNMHQEYIYARLPANRVEEEEATDAVLPGELYAILDGRDVLGTSPLEYEVVMGRGSRWAGVPEAYLCRVVEKYERRVLRWSEKREEGRTHVVA